WPGRPGRRAPCRAPPVGSSWYCGISALWYRARAGGPPLRGYLGAASRGVQRPGPHPVVSGVASLVAAWPMRVRHHGNQEQHDERGDLPRRGLDGEVEFLSPRVAFGVVFAVDGFVVAPGQQDEAGGDGERSCGHDAAWSSSSALSFSTSVRRY